jgi:hypothetical protein
MPAREAAADIHKALCPRPSHKKYVLGPHIRNMSYSVPATWQGLGSISGMDNNNKSKVVACMVVEIWDALTWHPRTGLVSNSFIALETQSAFTLLVDLKIKRQINSCFKISHT